MRRFKDFLNEKQVIEIESGLSRKEALKKALPKMKGDHRGFTYDPKTGKAIFV